MLLSIQQQYILEIVQKLGYVQRRQLHTLVRRQFQPQGKEISEARITAMLHQFRAYCQDIRLDSDGVWIVGAKADPRLLEAVDVMLELSDDTPADFRLEPSDPLVLRFILGGAKVRLFAVADLSAGSPDTLERQRMERIVWISDSGVVPPSLTLPPKHFFAARQADGSHRFYGSEES